MNNPLVKYKASHQNKINITIHKIAVPILFATAYASIPHIYITIPIHLFYSAHYLLYDLFSQKSIKIFTFLQIVYLFHFLFRQYVTPKYLFVIHFISWAAQFVGHYLENSQPAFINNLYDTLLFAPYFVFSEILQLSGPPCKTTHTIIYDTYTPSKKSILYFAGVFQRSESSLFYLDSEPPDLNHNHIFITCRFLDQDNFQNVLQENVLQDLFAIDSEIDRKIEYIVGYSFGGALAMQMKSVLSAKLAVDHGLNPTIPKCILISPGGFYSNTWVERMIRIATGILYSCYRNDKWYVLQQYPHYQNTNHVDETDYYICSRSDWIHNYKYPNSYANHMILYDNEGHWGILHAVKQEQIIRQLMDGGGTNPVKIRNRQWKHILFGSHFHLQIKLWATVSFYHFCEFCKMHPENFAVKLIAGCITAFSIGSFAEYVFHRWVLHAYFQKHHNRHHALPNKMSIIHTPAVLMVSFIGVWYGGLYVSIHRETLALMFIFGPLYYLIFEWTHYLSHIYRGRNHIIMNVKLYHKIHHIDPNTNYSFTTPLWDYLFGTLSPKYQQMEWMDLVLGIIPFWTFAIHPYQDPPKTE